MQKFTKEELAEFAIGVFKDDKESPSVYADSTGTFRNSLQFAAMTVEDREGFHEFKNPNVKQVEASGEVKVIVLGMALSGAEVERLISELKASSEAVVINLNASIAEANELRGKVTAHEAVAAAFAELKDLYEELKTISADKDDHIKVLEDKLALASKETATDVSLKVAETKAEDVKAASNKKGTKQKTV